MQSGDNEFFEEYKRLDKLCSEMYSCRNGVSEYITQMKNESYRGQYLVSAWDSDYKMLKHVRWIRNQIAHDSGTYQISEPEDLAFVRDFYNRIFSGQDSLTLLRKAIGTDAERRRKQKEKQANQFSAQTIPLPNTPQKKNSRGLIGVLIGIWIIALIFLLFYSDH